MLRNMLRNSMNKVLVCNESDLIKTQFVIMNMERTWMDKVKKSINLWAGLDTPGLDQWLYH